MNAMKSEGTVFMALAIVLLLATILGVLGFATWATMNIVGDGLGILGGQTSAVISTAATALL